MHRSIGDHVIYKSIVSKLRKLRVRILCLHRESALIQPVSKEEIHFKAAVQILRGVHMEIRKGGYENAVPVICQRSTFVFFRQNRPYAFNLFLLHSDVAIGVYSKMLSVF